MKARLTGALRHGQQFRARIKQSAADRAKRARIRADIEQMHAYMDARRPDAVIVMPTPFARFRDLLNWNKA